MNSDYSIARLSEKGMRDFCTEFAYIAGADRFSLLTLTQRLIKRMNSGALNHVDTCLPNDMTGKVLQDCLDSVDYVWTNDYKRITNQRVVRHGMGIEVMDLSWNPVAEAWLLHTVENYMKQNSQRLCIVLDMRCPDMVLEEDYPDIDDYYKRGLEEGYLFLPIQTVYKHFTSCLYWGLGKSYGCLVTLPEGLTRQDLMNSEGPLSPDTSTLLADCADAVYIGAYDGLGYMLGWFGDSKEQEGKWSRSWKKISK